MYKAPVLSESAIKAEIITDMAMVMANCWYSRPTMPGINPTGTNTAAKDKRNGDNRRRNILHGLVSSLLGRHLFMVDIMLHSFHHNNGIIHHNTNSQHKAKHG